MESKDREQLFAGLDLFESLPRERLLRLSRMLPTVGLGPGQILHGPGHRARIVYLVLRGRVRVYRVSGKDEVTLFYARAGDVFGEAAFKGQEGHQGVFSQAAEASEVALMRVETFEGIVREQPAVASKMVELLSRRISFLTDRVADAAFKDVAGRLCGLILHLAESEGLVTPAGYRIPNRYTHQQLGEMIGARRVAVTRSLAELRAAGSLEMERGLMHVRDVEALKRIAGRES